MRGNVPVEETARQIALDAVRIIKTLLPPGWDVSSTSIDDDQLIDSGYDALTVVRAPGGQTVTFLTEVKAGRVERAEQVLGRLRKTKVEGGGREVLLVAPYLGPALRNQCEIQGINYLDLTGWCWLQASGPALAIRAVGAAKDPRPSRTSAITRLNGASAGRIIRNLLATDQRPLGVRALAQNAAVSAGTVSKVLNELSSEAIVIRDDAGQVVAVRKRLLVTRWIRDYSFLKTNNVSWWLAPRGIQNVRRRALESNAWVVETGSSAARRLLPEGLLPLTAESQIALYVPRTNEAAELLGLVPADRTAANVLLAEPYDAELLRQRGSSTDVLPAVDVGQIVADLKTMPGRAQQEADQLMDAFAVTDKGWEQP